MPSASRTLRGESKSSDQPTTSSAVPRPLGSPPLDVDAVEAPRWDRRRHTLFWMGRPIKHFKSEAPHQEAILEAFETEGWAECVEPVLPEDPGVSPKERLHDTVRNLNRNVRPYLHFAQEGNGSRVRWEPRDYPNATLPLPRSRT